MERQTLIRATILVAFLGTVSAQDVPATLPVTTGLVCWFDAGTGVTAGANGVVQTWNDLSGNGHHGTLAAGAPVLAPNQINSRPAVQFRTSASPCGFNLEGPFFAGELYVVARSPQAAWNHDGCFLGRRWARNSSHRLAAKSTAFSGDQFPSAVSKNGKVLREPPFNLVPITDFMIVKIDVNEEDISRNSYQIGMGDSASCDLDIAEILCYQTRLSRSDEDWVGGYLAVKYGISTAYPSYAGKRAACSLTNAPASEQTASSATLNATLVCPGAGYDARVYWGTRNGGTDAGLWDNSALVGTWTHVASEKLSHKLTDLTPGVKYYFTFRGTNATDSLWAGNVLTFRLGGPTAANSATPQLPVTKGLACWYDAGDGVTTGNDGAIQTWNDKSDNGHHATPGRGTTVLAPNQLNAKPVVQFRNSWLALAGTFFAKEHFLVLRSPGQKWSGAAGLLGRLKGRGSSYNTWSKETAFWQDQYPAAVSRNGIVLAGPAFDCSPLNQYMILKIDVNDSNATAASYALGNNDGLAACDFDVGEILGYQRILSPAEEALVGGYLAAKYGIDTEYPTFPAVAPQAAASETTSVKYKGWQHSGSLYLLTTPEGADLPASASEENFPALVRLNKAWFNFSEAQADGEDVRFSAGDKPLAYEIDEWNAADGMASIWVRIPLIKGNARQEITMYWGKADAKSESSGASVFNKSNGYLGVWHMRDPVMDVVGTVESKDMGTTASTGMIGSSRHFSVGKGINCGDRITTYPFASSPHTSEAWIRPERLNTVILGWGRRDGVTMRLSCTPGHIMVDGGRQGVHGATVLKKSEWAQVAYTYDGQSELIYVNGESDVPAATLATRQVLIPVRLQIGPHFAGDLDEVRISRVARTADWIKLQYENQKPLQTLIGPLVAPGSEFSVSANSISIDEGQSATLTAKAGGAQKIYWILKKNGAESVIAVDQCSYTLNAGRVVGDTAYVLQLKAVFADEVKTRDIPVTIKEAIPEPAFTLKAPATWNGRDSIEVVPGISNLEALKARGAGELQYAWEVFGGAVLKETAPDRLILKLSQYTGPITVKAAINNGGADSVVAKSIMITEPKHDPWIQRVPGTDEKPEDGQFYARDDKNHGTLYYNGTLSAAAEAVFLKIYADDKLDRTETQKPSAENAYAFTVKLKPGLIKYKVEFGTKTGGTETVVQTVSDLVCGDAYLIDGQSNALATDTGEQSPPDTNEWICSYGGPAGRGDGTGWVRDRFGDGKDTTRKRTNLWCCPVWKAQKGEKAELGWWGMELAKRLLNSQKVPICIVNAAVGGTRIDEHQRSNGNPSDLNTMYGRMLWRVQQARLTHGIRAVLWHQGESDQGSDGPDGGYGWETYQQYFVNMSLGWKQDFPNIQHYYVFQIWPNACAMGNGHGDMLREVQRTLPRLYSKLDIMSTLGVKPPGPCHFPLVGWAEFARLIQPLIERDFYGKVPAASITAPNLKRAYYSSGAKDALALEFDQPVVWTDVLTGQFYLDGVRDTVASGTASGSVVTLKLKGASAAQKITYLQEMNWSQDKLLLGVNGIAALTFCDVPILPGKPTP